MQRIDLTPPPETSNRDWARRAEIFMERYEGLLAALTAHGTEVLRSRTLEEDTVPPFRFIRDAVHEFIFPPQEVEIEEDLDSGILPGTNPPEAPNNALTYEGHLAAFDASEVTGYLRVLFDNSDEPFFAIEDELGESVIPEALQPSINEAFLAVVLTKAGVQG